MALVFDPTKLYSNASQAEIFDFSISLAQGVGLPVSTWQVGDPTRTLFSAQAERLATVDIVNKSYFASGFLSSAEGNWLTILAQEVYQYDRILATYASGSATLKNATPNPYAWETNGLTFKNKSTGKTYKNAAPITLNPNSTVVTTWIAEEPGSGSTALVNSIDLMSTKPGITVVSSGAGVGLDQQSDVSVRLSCEAKHAALSPNGVWYAYEEIAKRSDLTGVPACRKAQVRNDGPNIPIQAGFAQLYVSNTSSLLSDAELAPIQNAVLAYGTPVGQFCYVNHATLKPVNAMGFVKCRPVGFSREQIQAVVATTLQGIVSDVPIGGGSGQSFGSGRISNLLFDERVYKALEDLSPGIVQQISITTDLTDDTIAPGELLVMAGTPEIAVYF